VNELRQVGTDIVASVVVLSHDRLEDLRRNVTQLLQYLGPQRAELIVVDNGSTDGSQAYLRTLATAHSDRVRIVLQEQNRGVAGGRNVGYRLAAGRYIVNLDDDALADGALLPETIRCFQDRDDVGILVYRIRHLRSGVWETPHGDEPTEVANFHGAGHAFRRELFDQVGYLDERCSFGGEEIEMSIRARNAGYQLLYVPHLIVQHNSLVRHGSVAVSRLLAWHRNYVRTLYRYFPRRMAAVYGFRLFVRFLVGHLGAGRIRGLYPFQLGRAFWAGRREGLREHVASPDVTIEFYRNPRLLPDLGNVPLSSSVLRRIWP
jgi:GT2 family glycosyltransferase